MNAPREADRPTASHRNAAPATTSKAVTVKTSGVRSALTARNTGGRTNRPPTRMAAIVSTPRPTLCHGKWSVAMPWPANSGTSATNGMNAMS